MNNARDILRDRVLLFDGGMGTYYKAAPGLECEQANLADPEGVLAVHREYLAETYTLLTAWSVLYQNPDYYQWAIVEKATGEAIGAISLTVSCCSEPEALRAWQKRGADLSEGIWEPGYCIGQPWWNHGYTTEALQAVADYWFVKVEGNWLACCHALDNPASGAVMQKAGFVYDHDAVYHKFDGTPVDCHVYRLTRADWCAHRRKESF